MTCAGTWTSDSTKWTSGPTKWTSGSTKWTGEFGDLRQGQASIREELGTMMSKKDLAVLRAELKAEVATEVGNVIKFDRERGGLA